MTDTPESPNADQIAYWNEIAGATWVANQARLDRVFAPLTEALIAGAAPRSGERVLDVGCGCGETSLIVAAHVGASGHVLGVDLSLPMLERARARAAAAASALDFVQADAMTHAFAPTTDLVISRFGVMFFADPLTAFANLRRALKPDGRFAFICWRERRSVAWMQWPLDQIATLLPPPADTTGEPGPFGLADAEATLAILTKAGFSAVTATPVDAALTIGAGADPVGDAMTLLIDTGPAARLLKEAEADTRAKATDLLRRALETKRVDGVITLDAACWLYRGQA